MLLCEINKRWYGAPPEQLELELRVIDLYDNQNLSYSAIARMIDISPQRARLLYHRGQHRQQLLQSRP